MHASINLQIITRAPFLLCIAHQTSATPLQYLHERSYAEDCPEKGWSSLRIYDIVQRLIDAGL